MPCPHRGELVPTWISARLAVTCTAVRDEIRWNIFANHLVRWRKSHLEYPQRRSSTPHLLLSCEGLLRPTPQCYATPHHGERLAPHGWPPRPCHEAAGLGHLAAHSPGSARPEEDSLGVLWPRHQSQVLLVSSAQAKWQQVESLSKHLNGLRGKNPLQLEGDCASLQQAVHCLFRPTQSGTQKAHERSPQPPPFEPLIQAIKRVRLHSGHKEGGLFQRQVASPCPTLAILVSTAWPSRRSSPTS